MPRGQEPKKDAERGETWWGSCMQAMSPPNPNGATPRPGRDETTAYEAVGGTGGTETSQYPEEAESRGAVARLPTGRFLFAGVVWGEARSSGERTGLAPKPLARRRRRDGGVVGPDRVVFRKRSDRTHGVMATRRVWEGPPERVRVP